MNHEYSASKARNPESHNRSTSRLAFARRSKISKAVAIQEAARKSLIKLLKPLSAFVFDCGLSISELNLILRTAAVESVAARQLENSNRVNISGVAAITGIPRAEVSRILNPSGSLTIGAIQGRPSITSRILSAWHCDPDYLTTDRRARDLKIFGAGPTFESLVRTYGQGIPVRAILDELKHVGAIQLLTSSQKIRPKMFLAINPRITHKIVRELGATTDDLFLCLNPSDAAFERVFGAKVWSGPVPQVRRRLGPNAMALLRELQTILALKKPRHRSKHGQWVAHLSMKIVYKETQDQLAKRLLKSRRNFHRIR
jgi:Family of unknown function (DUF6502)